MKAFYWLFMLLCHFRLFSIDGMENVVFEYDLTYIMRYYDNTLSYVRHEKLVTGYPGSKYIKIHRQWITFGYCGEHSEGLGYGEGRRARVGRKLYCFTVSIAEVLWMDTGLWRRGRGLVGRGDGDNSLDRSWSTNPSVSLWQKLLCELI